MSSFRFFMNDKLRSASINRKRPQGSQSLLVQLSLTTGQWTFWLCFSPRHTDLSRTPLQIPLCVSCELGPDTGFVYVIWQHTTSLEDKNNIGIISWIHSNYHAITCSVTTMEFHSIYSSCPCANAQTSGYSLKRQEHGTAWHGKAYRAGGHDSSAA